MVGRKVLKSMMILGLCMMLLTGCDTFTSEKDEVIIFAAASLTESFLEIEEVFEKDHPSIDLVINFAGSQMLYNQIISGTKPSMFFSANEKYIDQLIEAEDFKETDKTNFAYNQVLMLVRDEYSVSDFEGFISLLKGKQTELSVILAHEDVPVGDYSLNIWDNYLEITGDIDAYTDFFESVVSYEQDVKSVLSKILIGEGDVGMVYRSDAIFSDLNDYIMIQIPESYDIEVSYYSLCLGNDQVENEVYTFITQGQGQEILAKYGLN